MNNQPQAKKPHLGGTYLKPGTLKRETACLIDGRAGTVPNHKGGPRTVEGEYGRQLELPVSIDGMEFVVSIPADKGDGLALQKAWGDDLSSWVGKRVLVQESNVLRRIRVSPIS